MKKIYLSLIVFVFSNMAYSGVNWSPLSEEKAELVKRAIQDSLWEDSRKIAENCSTYKEAQGESPETTETTFNIAFVDRMKEVYENTDGDQPLFRLTFVEEVGVRRKSGELVVTTDASYTWVVDLKAVYREEVVSTKEVNEGSLKDPKYVTKEMVEQTFYQKLNCPK